MKKDTIKRIIAMVMAMIMVVLSGDYGMIIANAQQEKEVILPTGGRLPLEGYCITEEEAQSPESEEETTGPIYGSAFYTSEWDCYSTYYYYNQLNDNLKQAWDELYDYCLQLLEEDIDLSDTKTSYISFSEPVSKEECDRFVHFFTSSNPQFYFINNQYSFSISSSETFMIGRVALGVYSSFCDGELRAEATTLIKDKIDEILSQISENDAEDEILKYLHDYVVNHAEYNSNVIIDGITNDEEELYYTQSLYSALVLETTVCVGYAELLQLLCNAVDIDTVNVSSESHQWNKVCINDVWYNVDPTWADQDFGIYYYYYGRSDLFYSEDNNSHTIEDLIAGYDPVCSIDNVTSTPWDAPGDFVAMTDQVTTPEIIIQLVEEEFVVTITSQTEGATIYYTTDGKEPSSSATKSNIYSEAFTVEEGTVVKAIAVKDALLDSAIAVSTATPPVLPTITLLDGNDVSDYDGTYNGSSHTPEIIVTDGELILKENEDYTVTYGTEQNPENINAGEGGICVTFIGEYSGSVELTFWIERCDMSYYVVPSLEDYVYTGDVIYPQLTIVHNGIELEMNVDYIIDFGDEDHTFARENIPFTIRFVGNYFNSTDDITGSISIVPLKVPVKDYFLIQFNETYEYTGEAICPTKDDFVILDDFGIEIPQEWYSIVENSYKNNTNAGTATFDICFDSDSIKGIMSFEYVIGKTTLTEIVLTVSGDMIYTGEALIPNIVVTSGDLNLKAGVDYNIYFSNSVDHTNVGNDIPFTIYLTGNYIGEVEGEFNIVPASPETEVLVGETSVDNYEVIYDGTVHKPNVVVQIKDTQQVLEEGVDYTVTYGAEANPDNKNAGKGYVTITFKGNYTGVLVHKFTIKPLEVTESTEIIIQDSEGSDMSEYSAEYNGSMQKPTFVITFDGITLKEDIDYTVTYGTEQNPENKNAGYGGYKISFIGNYSGTLSKEFTIRPYDMSKTELGEIAGVTYTGNKLYPVLALEIMGNELVPGTDYTILIAEDQDSINVGEEIPFVVSFRNNYEGLLEGTFSIIPVDLQSQEFITVEVEDSYVFTGEDILLDETKFVVYNKNGEVIPADWYSIDENGYKDNVNAGEATCTIIFNCDNITGTYEFKYTIKPVVIENITVTVLGDVDYTGEDVYPELSVTCGELVFELYTDYFISFGTDVDHKNPGEEIPFIVTLFGNYEGSATGTFNILTTVPPVITSEDYAVNDEKGYVSKIALETTVEAFLESIPEKEYVVILDKNGEVVTGESLLGTGMKVQIMDVTTVVKSYTVIVTGDTNGDGKVNITDMMAIKACVLKKGTLTDVYEIAADTNGDGKINITDFIKTKAVTLKKDTIQPLETK